MDHDGTPLLSKSRSDATPALSLFGWFNKLASFLTGVGLLPWNPAYCQGICANVNDWCPHTSSLLVKG
jgi:hypothetical protein